MLPRRLLALAGAVLAVAVSTTAVSADGAGSSPGSGDDPTRATSTTSAKCPKGEVAIGGGFTGEPGETVVENRRTRGNRWTVGVTDQDGGDSFGGVSVVCSEDADITVVRETATFPSDDHAPLALTAHCPFGTAPISGGWVFTKADTSDSPVFTSRPVGRGWKVRAFASDTSNRLTVFAYCDAGMGSVLTLRVAGEPVAGNATAAAKVTCPNGQAVGGGFGTSPRSDPSGLSGPDFSYFQSDLVGRRSWQVRAQNLSAWPGDSRATVYVICGAAD